MAASIAGSIDFDMNDLLFRAQLGGPLERGDLPMRRQGRPAFRKVCRHPL
jgi:hypothetical protein